MKKEIEEAAEKLSNIAEAHLSKLTPRERAARMRAFRKVVSKIGGFLRSKKEKAEQSNRSAQAF